MRGERQRGANGKTVVPETVWRSWSILSYSCQLVAGASVIMEYSALWFTLHEVSLRSAKLQSVLSKSVPIYIYICISVRVFWS